MQKTAVSGRSFFASGVMNDPTVDAHDADVTPVFGTAAFARRVTNGARSAGSGTPTFSFELANEFVDSIRSTNPDAGGF